MVHSNQAEKKTVWNCETKKRKDEPLDKQSVDNDSIQGFSQKWKKRFYGKKCLIQDKMRWKKRGEKNGGFFQTGTHTRKRLGGVKCKWLKKGGRKECFNLLKIRGHKERCRRELNVNGSKKGGKAVNGSKQADIRKKRGEC